MRSTVAAGVLTLAQLFTRSKGFQSLCNEWSEPSNWVCLIKPVSIVLFMAISSRNDQVTNATLILMGLNMFLFIEVYYPSLTVYKPESIDTAFNVIGWLLLLCGVICELETSDKDIKRLGKVEDDESEPWINSFW